LIQTQRQNRLRMLSRGGGGLLITLGLLVLSGWAWDIPILKSVFPGLATMKPNTAVAFMLSGYALWLLSPNPRPGSWQRRWATLLGLAVLLIGLLTLSQYLLGWDLGIDRVLFSAAVQLDSQPPGRMSPASALNFFLFGSAFVLLDSRHRFAQVGAQVCTLVGGILASLTLVGYAYGIQALYSLGFASTIALPTAIGFFILALSMLGARPEREPLLTATSDLAGGLTIRRLWPIVFSLLLLLGWLEVSGEQLGLYAGQFVTALFTVSALLLVSFLIWHNASFLERLDAERLQSEVRLRQQAEELEKRVAERTASLQEALFTTETLYRVMRAVIAVEQLSELLQTVVDSAAQALTVDRVTLIIFDQEEQRVTSLIRGGQGYNQIATDVSYDELQDGLSGWVLREKRSALSPKSPPDPRESAAVQKRRAETNCGSIIVVPVQYQGRMLGTMTAINTPEQPDFTETEVALMETIANQAAVAISRVMLLEQLQTTNQLLASQQAQLQQELTLRSTIEATLRQNENELRRLFENAPAMYLRVREQAGVPVIAAANQAFLEKLGYTLAEVLDQPLANFYAPESRRQLLAGGFRQALQTKITVERQLITRSGAIIDTILRATPEIDARGVVIGSLAMYEDITQRKRAEEALAYERDLLNALLDNIPDTIYFKDRESRFTRINQAQAKMLGVASPEEAIGKTDFDFFDPTLAKQFFAEEQALLSSGQPLIDRTEFNPTRDGQPRWLSASKVPIRTQAGEIVGLVGVSRNITERIQVEAKLRRQNEFLSLLHEISLDLMRRPNVTELLEALVLHASRLLDAPYGEIMLLEGEELVVRACTPNQMILVGQRVGRAQAQLSWQALDTRQPAVLEDYATWPHRREIYSEMALHAVADFPIVVNEQSLGVLAIGRNTPGYAFDADQVQFGALFAQLVALVLDNAQLRETLWQQSIRDPLTDLFNRRYMEETLARQIHRVSRKHAPLGIIMLDLDHFKRFNDNFGHLAGDALLRAMGQHLKHHIRADDVACRYGGEEFTLILPEASLEVTRQRAELMRASAHQLQVHFDGRPLGTVTLSLGVACFPEHGHTAEAVLHAADAALYKAKQAGRNCVMVAEVSTEA